MRKFFSLSRENVKSTKTADGFTKTFPEWPRTLMEGMELRLCFVTSLLSSTLLRFCVNESFVGKFLDLNTNRILHGNGRGVRPLFGGYYSLVFRCFFVLTADHVILKMQETVPTVCSSYPRRLLRLLDVQKRLTICRCNYKSSTLSSVRPWVLVRFWARTLDLPHSRLALYQLS